MTRPTWNQITRRSSAERNRARRPRHLFRPYVERVEDRCLLSYVLTDLGTLGGTYSFAAGINASGQVVGDSTTAAGNDHAFLLQRRGDDGPRHARRHVQPRRGHQ
jgi:hypothetical protein